MMPSLYKLERVTYEVKCAHGILLTFSGLSDETTEEKMAENIAALHVVAVLLLCTCS